MYKDFSNWELYEGFSCGSGTSTQEWIITKNGEIALFKNRKSDDTTDNFSEKIASEIAEIIELPCARIDLAKRNGKIGMVSYKINSQSQILVEGIQYISNAYSEYNRDTLIDEKTQDHYSLEIILNSIKGLNLEKDLFKIFIFDFLIGNGDRHHSNWALLKESEQTKICPVYDNSSSLCFNVNDEKINLKDKNWLKAQVDTKSKSLIYLQGKKVTHSKFISYLKDNYYSETIDFVNSINQKFTYDVIEKLINRYDNLLSNKKIILLKEYLKMKVELLKKIYEI